MHITTGLPVLNQPSFEAVNRCYLTFFSGLQPPSTSTSWCNYSSCWILHSSLMFPASLSPSSPPSRTQGQCKMRPKFTFCLYFHLALLPWLYPLSYSPIPTFFFHPCTRLFPTSLFYHLPSHLGPPAQQDPLAPPSIPGGGGCHPSTVGVRSLARSPQSCMWHQHWAPPSPYSVHIHLSPSPP